MSGFARHQRNIDPRSSARGAKCLRSHGARFQWVREHDDQLFLSAITLARFKQVSRSSNARFRAPRRRFAHWLQRHSGLYDSRTLSFTSSAALEAGRLLDRAIGAGTDPSFEDAAIAATAAVHDLTVVTANTRHFEHFGVPFISPFDE
jgi:predicted nucleic acid-binding protein